MILDHKKFSWAEAFASTKSGKTSIPLISGFMLCTTGGIGFLYALFLKNGEGMGHSFGFATLGTALLGIRRLTPDKEIKKDEPI